MSLFTGLAGDGIELIKNLIIIQRIKHLLINIDKNDFTGLGNRATCECRF